MARAEAPQSGVDPTAAVDAAALEVPPELVAQSLGEYLRAWTQRIRGGDSGVLPVIAGIILITLVFEVISPNHVFLSAGNLVNLFQQSAVFMVLAMAEIFALLLGEIDLSGRLRRRRGRRDRGSAGAAGHHQVAVVGRDHRRRRRLRADRCPARHADLSPPAPSFIVTLAGLLYLNGLVLILLQLGPFSGYPSLVGQGPDLKVLYNLMWGTIDPLISWVGAGLVVGGLGISLWLRDAAAGAAGWWPRRQA